jgi:hypothetical protein
MGNFHSRTNFNTFSTFFALFAIDYRSNTLMQDINQPDTLFAASGCACPAAHAESPFDNPANSLKTSICHVISSEALKISYRTLTIAVPG